MDGVDHHPFKITVIGNGAALPAAGKYHSSQVLNVQGGLYLTDCGEGTQKAMLENNLNPQKLKAIFITHLHGDHLYGLFPLLDTLSLSPRAQPLQVFAPPPLSDLLQATAGILREGRPYGVVYHPVDTTIYRKIYENAGLEVWAVPLKHRQPCAGYLFREKMAGLNIRKDVIPRYSLTIDEILAVKSGSDLWRDGVRIPNEALTYLPYLPRSYAYCTDTVFSPGVARWVKGVDLLYHEASFASSDGELARRNGHSTSTQAAEIAVRAGVKKLLIGHFSGRYKDPSRLVAEARRVFPCTEEAEEGKVYEIMRERMTPDGSGGVGCVETG